MTKVFGHTIQRQVLEQDLPPVTLLRGPSSIGKRVLSEHLREHHQVEPADRIHNTQPLSIDMVRSHLRYVSFMPFGAFKLVQLDMDDASTQAQNALLKVLEEPPPRARFLLTTSQELLPTVLSRCRIFDLGLLGFEDMTEILKTQGLNDAAARTAARLGIGRVEPTLEAIRLTEQRDAVLNLAAAVGTHDHVLFDRVCRTWNETSHHLFLIWIAENITGQWRFFTEDQGYGIPTHTLVGMLTALGTARGARPRLAVRAALLPYLTRS